MRWRSVLPRARQPTTAKAARQAHPTPSHPPLPDTPPAVLTAHASTKPRRQPSKTHPCSSASCENRRGGKSKTEAGSEGRPGRLAASHSLHHKEKAQGALRSTQEALGYILNRHAAVQAKRKWRRSDERFRASASQAHLGAGQRYSEGSRREEKRRERKRDERSRGDERRVGRSVGGKKKKRENGEAGEKEGKRRAPRERWRVKEGGQTTKGVRGR